jgi:hypothetical protein
MVMLMALVAGLGMVRAQFSPVVPQASSSGPVDLDRGSDDEPYVNRELQLRQLKRLRELHQHEVLSDTARMEQLAAAMKEEVDKGNKTLNADVMKDADEINKLAKRVSERIKTQ